MFEIKPARTLHEIYEQDFLPQRETGIREWREWLTGQWRKHIEFYASHHWSMMPIAPRGKRPVQNRSNYRTIHKKWPPLRVKQAVNEWASKNFNIAVVGMHEILWLDINEPKQVPSSFLEAAGQYLIMRTARGLAIPVERDGKTRELGKRFTKQLGGIGVDTIRKSNSYQLVPLSITCTQDTGTSKHRVDFGKSACVDGGKHDLRAREWIDLSAPVMTQRTLRGLLP